MSTSGPANAMPIPSLPVDESRTCWVCLASEEDAPKEEWVRPCGCRGATKWVHQICLNRWVTIGRLYYGFYKRCTSCCKARQGHRTLFFHNLYRWIDEKQKGNSLAKVFCPQCNKAYAFSLPKINNMVRVLDFAEKTISKSCPYIAGGLFVGAAYWSAVTYGAITVMQVGIIRNAAARRPFCLAATLPRMTP